MVVTMTQYLIRWWVAAKRNLGANRLRHLIGLLANEYSTANHAYV